MSSIFLTRRTFGLTALSLFAVSHASADNSKRRIVALGGGITEILYRLELGAAIVGVDATSVYPPEALATKPNLGYVRTLGAEGILSLRPDIVLADAIAGPPDTLALIERTGVRIVRVPEGLTAADLNRRIAVIAETTGRVNRGLALEREVASNLGKISENRAKIASPKKVLFILSMSNGRVMVGGTGTNIDHLLSLVGASNAASMVQGWKPLSEEGILAAAPDMILALNRGQGPGGVPDDIFALPAFAGTPSAKTKALLKIDGPYLFNYGPRTPLAALELQQALYPILENQP